jgi:hypothetical protein
MTLFRGHGRFTGENGRLVTEKPFMVILLPPFEHFKASEKKIEEIRRIDQAQFSTGVRCSAWITSSACAPLCSSLGLHSVRRRIQAILTQRPCRSRACCASSIVRNLKTPRG